MSGDGGWGPKAEKQAISLVHYALDSGCTFIDTARGYGHAEKVVGKALLHRRDQVVVASKMIHCPPHQLRQAIDRSLKNLQTDYIDLYICHWPRSSLELAPFFEELIRQQNAGKIRAFGVSNFNLPQMKVARDFGAVSLQPPFSILWRFADELASFCQKNNVAVTPYSPLAQGLLTGRFSRNKRQPTGPRARNQLFSETMFPASLAVAQKVDAIADRLGVSSAQVALAWVLQTPGITVPVVGASSPQQWDEHTATLSLQLSDRDYQELDLMGKEVWQQFGLEATMWGHKPA